MVSRGTIVYFQFLAILATALLWGICLANGGVKALLLAVWHGRLSDDIPLRRSYLGFPPLDYLIALLVAFFFHGTTSHHEDYHLFLVDAYSALQPAFVWLPIVFATLWQCFGGAIALPLYYMVHLPWAGSGGCMRVRHTEQAFAIPFSFLVGAVLPAIIGMGTRWFSPGTRSSDMHQLILGLWQLDPVWVSCVQIILSKAYAMIGQSSRNPGTTKSDNGQSGYFWTSTAYLTAAIMSGVGHLYTVWKIATNGDSGGVFGNMYVPWPLGALSGGQDVFVFSPWLFLQYDYVIISLSSLSWVYYLLQIAPQHRKPSPQALALVLLLGSVTFGPGTTVSLALWYREAKLLAHQRSD
ncbi:hypothetical protein F4806DRAFT_505373 [Annulohypoxylon nitens]|nr:hypothetical protein F4806DRAFT_505373 [Annulohypoxylon nitens]